MLINSAFKIRVALNIDPSTGLSTGTTQEFVTGISQAFGLAYDNNYNLYCSKHSNGGIIKIDPSGNQSVFALPGCGAYIAFDDNQNLYCPNPGPGYIRVFLNSITTVINVDSSFSKVYGQAPFNLDVSSNSPAAINYSSNNNLVATVNSSGVVTLLSSGTATITISQNAISGYTSASAQTTVNVTANSASNPVGITNANELNSFLNTNAIYSSIVNDISVNNNIVNGSATKKGLLNNTSKNVELTK